MRTVATKLVLKEKIDTNPENWAEAVKKVETTFREDKAFLLKLWKLVETYWLNLNTKNEVQKTVKFLNKSVMKSHTKEIHLTGKFKKCSYCDYKTSQKSWTVLKEHIDAKHPPNSNERNYFCEQCSKNFKYLYSFNQHKLSHSEKIKVVYTWSKILKL